MATDDIKRAAPLELFFDLVFVFAITQIVSLIVHDLTWSGLFHGALILALLWWAWGQFTWTANAIDLEPRMVRVVFLASMVVIFVMAQAVPFAFDGSGKWLAFGYILIRVLGFWMFWKGTAHDDVLRKALRTIIPASFVGPIVIVIGAFMGDAQQWWWLAGWALEMASAAVVGQRDWHLEAEHFAERHGLIMIIAFGEAIVVIGATVADVEPSWELAGLLAVGILGAMALWWSYFDRMEELWEWALLRADEHEVGAMARDVYSILHLPMIGGVILYAVSVEEVFHDPNTPIGDLPYVQVTLGLSLLLFILPIVAATWRAVRGLQFERGLAAVLIAAFVFTAGDMAAKNVLLVTTFLLVIAVTLEYWRFRTRIREGLPTENV